jgi:hypothetical protein
MSCFTSKTYKDRRAFIDSITYLKSEDLKPKTTMERLKKMCPLLNEYNALTHSIYLKANPDMPEDEKQFHQDIIATLMDKEQKQVQEALKVLKDKHAYIEAELIED